MAAVAIRPQQMIGNWLVAEELGKGSFSVVHKVFHNKIVAAAKITRSTNPHLTEHDTYDSFKKEGLLLIDLKKWAVPNVVDIFEIIGDFTSSKDWTLALIIEYIPGKTLWEQFCTGKRGMNAEEALTVLEGSLQTLYALDQNEIVHGDLAPNNIMMYGQTVKIIDWTIAHKVSHPPGFRTTALSYASIEMLLFIGWTTKTDLFSLSASILGSITQCTLANWRDKILNVLHSMEITCDEPLPSSMIAELFKKYDPKELPSIECRNVGGTDIYSLKPLPLEPRPKISAVIKPFLDEQPEISGKIYNLLRKMLVFDPAKRIDAKSAYQEVLEIRKRWQR